MSTGRLSRSTTFPGFTSRCAKPRPCKAAMAGRSCAPTSAASAGVNGPFSWISWSSAGPSTYSIRMYGTGSAQPSASSRGSAGCRLPVSASTSQRKYLTARSRRVWRGRATLSTAGLHSRGYQTSHVSQRPPTPSRSIARVPPGNSEPCPKTQMGQPSSSVSTGSMSSGSIMAPQGLMVPAGRWMFDDRQASAASPVTAAGVTMPGMTCVAVPAAVTTRVAPATTPKLATPVGTVAVQRLDPGHGCSPPSSVL